MAVIEWCRRFRLGTRAEREIRVLIATGNHEVPGIVPRLPAGALHVELEDCLGDVTHGRILEQAFGSQSPSTMATHSVSYSGRSSVLYECDERRRRLVRLVADFPRVNYLLVIWAG